MGCAITVLIHVYLTDWLYRRGSRGGNGWKIALIVGAQARIEKFVSQAISV
jgi:hypothetical protein